MSWTIYAILIIFGLFIVLMIINPNLSCFGRRIRSPFYPVIRKRKKATTVRDYKFDLGSQPKKLENSSLPGHDQTKAKKKKTEDYGFKLD
ncbi:MAG TPA: hypothetical protein PLP57_02500 [Candidatus Saccharicenans sp.]|jgi:hypothetical protein|nr:hypothetical protein [Candidatus Saccharicenans sp.]HRD01499.1 hypothetical protein [Candidatus Saccharicenans sp.]